MSFLEHASTVVEPLLQFSTWVVHALMTHSKSVKRWITLVILAMFDLVLVVDFGKEKRPPEQSGLRAHARNMHVFADRCGFLGCNACLAGAAHQKVNSEGVSGIAWHGLRHPLRREDCALAPSRKLKENLPGAFQERVTSDSSVMPSFAHARIEGIVSWCGV